MAARRSSTAPSFEDETAERRRRRRIREYREKVEELAIDLNERDPEVGSMKEARAKARDIIDTELAYEKGVLDVRPKAKPKRAGKKDLRLTKSKARRHRTARAPRARAGRVFRRTAREVGAPYRPAASVLWTFVTGGLGLTLLLFGLRNAGTVDAFLSATSGGLRAFADPYRPLFAGVDDQPPTPRTRGMTRGGRR